MDLVRLAMPREGTCRFSDLVRGEVEVEWASEADHVIQRADGSCLYHLASGVDVANAKAQGLRIALAIMVCVNAWSFAHYLLAARHLERDSVGSND